MFVISTISQCLHLSALELRVNVDVDGFEEITPVGMNVIVFLNRCSLVYTEGLCFEMLYRSKLSKLNASSH